MSPTNMNIKSFTFFQGHKLHLNFIFVKDNQQCLMLLNNYYGLKPVNYFLTTSSISYLEYMYVYHSLQEALFSGARLKVLHQTFT